MRAHTLRTVLFSIIEGCPRGELAVGGGLPHPLSTSFLWHWVHYQLYPAVQPLNVRSDYAHIEHLCTQFEEKGYLKRIC
jgi:hypothetical protein